MEGITKYDTLDLAIDIVFVIDTTQDMEPHMQAIKKTIIKYMDRFYNYLCTECIDYSFKLRAKCICYRDFYFDGEYAFDESIFYNYSDEIVQFHQFINSIKSGGGGDIPESGFEALILALQADFAQIGNARRHIIILFTNAEAHTFEDYRKLTSTAVKYGCFPITYPANTPQTYDDFRYLWNDCDYNLINDYNVNIDPVGKRLILITPLCDPWNDIEIEIEYCMRLSFEYNKDELFDGLISIAEDSYGLLFDM